MNIKDHQNWSRKLRGNFSWESNLFLSFFFFYSSNGINENSSKVRFNFRILRASHETKLLVLKKRGRCFRFIPRAIFLPPSYLYFPSFLFDTCLLAKWWYTRIHLCSRSKLQPEFSYVRLSYNRNLTEEERIILRTRA